ncbi:related to UTR1 (associated with ferric reductase activity) [Fusarium fujikuroi]|nr:related to UTR1 (associated with ferric reductase activity) [Fusarium fujikuroi]SCN94669.1 related to UTR1 (associated with ferric reductase activity) [Fusarium fujikuroi]SCO02070.1 related to UTR1 (associated with ferric reductase activity) [Fusarium fujikuroi]SCO48490.1 related to UTR1 (associated with ferric reductase activity) [Fusarium fujikuroi]SCV31077.1 related to UTR1 (associated with ferric reductase activity) [Fusarium fujikuroi]
MGDHTEKHIHFEDGRNREYDGSSDEDCKAVEVVFDPGNPYRRKSSMVASEIKAPVMRHPSRRDECLVHQFLDSQRRAKDAASSASEPESEPSIGNNSPSYLSNNPNPSHATFHKALNGDHIEAVRDDSLDSIVDPKYQKKCRAVVKPGGMEHSGQADQQAWTQQMTKSMSDVDLSGYQDDVRSRLLTKQQLSDMAWGVRELSRRLSSMRLRFKVKSIFILTKIYDQDLIPKTRELVKWLLQHSHEVAYTVYVQDKLKTNKKFDVSGIIDEVSKGYLDRGDMNEQAVKETLNRRLRYWDENMCRTRPHTFDFVISLGGDGTVLYASWLFQRIVPPVLSFALGSLGFLTKFDFEDYQQTLLTAFTKGVTVSLRLRFEGTVMRSQPRKRAQLSQGPEEDEEQSRDLVEELIGEEREDEHTHRPDGTFEILNEVVVDRGPNPTMSTTEIFGDDEHFTSVLADGICVSTPTGSTAYNLAAGGSLCHPENPVMLVTSICAHTLSFRPIILPDTIVLRVGVPYSARTASWASFDGRERVELKPGDYVTISASRFPFASVQAEGRRSEDWVNSISGKLGWNTRQKQKSYKEWEK